MARQPRGPPLLTSPSETPESAEHLAALSVSFYTVSRPLELSLQSSLQLSLTVLVCYWSRGNIEPWVNLTTDFGLRSQTTRLEGSSYQQAEQPIQVLHLLWTVAPIKGT